MDDLWAEGDVLRGSVSLPPGVTGSFRSGNAAITLAGGTTDFRGIVCDGGSATGSREFPARAPSWSKVTPPGLEPGTNGLKVRCSTIELEGRAARLGLADNAHIIVPRDIVRPPSVPRLERQPCHSDRFRNSRRCSSQP